MIPVKLTLQGIYSYRKRQVVDFENLTNSGLFGLFGNVGSGKSTIIEAISFALYGETERLNSKEGRNYNMMNLKSDELLIDFEFKTGADQHYRFVVKGRRHPKKFDDVKTFDRHAYRLNGLEWVPLESTSVESITGLSYKNFHRTIIIPQGKFMEFLQLGASERTKMLQELFGLERFELLGQVADLQARNNAELQHFNGQFQSVGEVDPDQISILEKLLIDYQLELSQLSSKSEVLSNSLEEMNRLKSLQQKIDGQQLILKSLLTDEPSILASEREVAEYERIASMFKSNVERLSSLQQSHQKYCSEREEIRKNLTATDDALTKLKPHLEKYRELYQAKDQLILKANELDKVLNVRDLELKGNALKSRLSNLKAELTKGDEQVLELRKVLDDNKMQVDVLTRSMPNRDTLMAVKEWFTHLNNYQASLKESETKVLHLNTELASTVSKLKQLPFERGLDLSQIQGQSAQQQLNELKQAVENSLSDSRKELLELEIQNKLQDFANTLHDGKPCPLCGSLEHPHVLNAQDVSQHIERLRSKVDDFQRQLKFIAEVEKEMTQLEVQVQSHNHQFLSEMQILNDKSRVLMEHQQMFSWKDYSPLNEQQVNDAIGRVQKMSLQLEKLTQNVTLLQKQLEQLEGERLQIQKSVDEDEKQYFAIESQMKLLISQLSIVAMPDVEQLSNDSIQHQSEALRKQYNDVVKQYEEGLRNEQELVNQKALLSGKLESLVSTIESINLDLGRVNGQINSDLGKLGLSSLTFVKEVLSKKLDVESIKNRIQNWRKDLEVAQGLIGQYMSDLQGRKFDEVAYNETINTLQQLTAKVADLNRIIGKTSTDILRLKADVEKQQAIRKQIEILELRASDLVVMKGLFMGSGFVNYVSTVHLQNLCKVANERFFKLTRQQLSLELDGNNSFQVRDFMNEGRVRSVKTLSGGQTFQASLSLALALADSIQHLNSSHENFFFLDEGFGTLDKESLSIVFETLKALRKENRIVGVISHVEEMQQEIQTYLKVVNKEETGSLIYESWKQ